MLQVKAVPSRYLGVLEIMDELCTYVGVLEMDKPCSYIHTWCTTSNGCTLYLGLKQSTTVNSR